MVAIVIFFFFQAEDGIRDRSPSRGLGDVYKRQKKSRVSMIFKISLIRDFFVMLLSDPAHDTPVDLH